MLVVIVLTCKYVQHHGQSLALTEGGGVTLGQVGILCVSHRSQRLIVKTEMWIPREPDAAKPLYRVDT